MRPDQEAQLIARVAGNILTHFHGDYLLAVYVAEKIVDESLKRAASRAQIQIEHIALPVP